MGVTAHSYNLMEKRMYTDADYRDTQSMLDSIIAIKNTHRRIIEEQLKIAKDRMAKQEINFRVEMTYQEWKYQNTRMKDIYTTLVNLLGILEAHGMQAKEVNDYSQKELIGEYDRWGV